MDKFFTLCNVPNKGRGLVAVRDITKGQILFAERPIVSLLNEDKLGEYCSYCFNLLAFSEAESDGFDTFHIDCNDLGEKNLLFKYAGIRNRDYKMTNNQKFPSMARLILAQTLANHFEAQTAQYSNPWNGILSSLCFDTQSERSTDRECYDEYIIWLNDYLHFDYNDICNILPFELYDRCIRILNRNCMQVSYEDEPIGTALFGLGSFFNHSCLPNVQLMDKMQSMTGRGMFQSVADIEKGQELCLKYVDLNDFDSFDDMQRYLMFAYGFQCKCSQCLEMSLKSI